MVAKYIEGACTALYLAFICATFPQVKTNKTLHHINNRMSSHGGRRSGAGRKASPITKANTQRTRSNGTTALERVQEKAIEAVLATKQRPAGRPTKRELAQERIDALKQTFNDQFDTDIKDLGPLETIEYARMFYLQGFKNTGDLLLLNEAKDCASQSLPYLKARLTATTAQVTVTNPLDGLSMEDLTKLLTNIDSTMEPVVTSNAIVVKPKRKTKPKPTIL